MIVFSFTALFTRAMWAYKPFLSLSYISYMWGGIGLSFVPCPIIRRIIGTSIFVVALSSLVPYFTTWQKTDAHLAFRSLGSLDQGRILLLERAYTAPVARYYLDQETEVWGLMDEGKKTLALVKISFDESLLGDFQPIECFTGELESVIEVWVQGSAARVRQEMARWPACIKDKTTFIFEGGRWIYLYR